eukprot:CAMPEP_0198315916 /NCGR_PEP_ID=MMETSP1450-20131203/6003_1 /TAXON_ID=753684 ORGANISM="Madagascaria erythrocladiodes, Strain CCMP3234" /NCGR_SAMPLE_ID=MMETSP1450 /ASSEMBLY_ACC=CAM_ASM_001115 /LENGTH=363 /DNA_ID=CAMNT_0044019043 /DNA_START=47 /DNA_END=1135 /DNA_ORIENTATION=+
MSPTLLLLLLASLASVAAPTRALSCSEHSTLRCDSPIGEAPFDCGCAEEAAEAPSSAWVYIRRNNPQFGVRVIAVRVHFNDSAARNDVFIGTFDDWPPPPLHYGPASAVLSCGSIDWQGQRLARAWRNPCSAEAPYAGGASFAPKPPPPLNSTEYDQLTEAQRDVACAALLVPYVFENDDGTSSYCLRYNDSEAVDAARLRWVTDSATNLTLPLASSAPGLFQCMLWRCESCSTRYRFGQRRDIAGTLLSLQVIRADGSSATVVDRPGGSTCIGFEMLFRPRDNWIAMYQTHRRVVKFGNWRDVLADPNVDFGVVDLNLPERDLRAYNQRCDPPEQQCRYNHSDEVSSCIRGQCRYDGPFKLF